MMQRALSKQEERLSNEHKAECAKLSKAHEDTACELKGHESRTSGQLTIDQSAAVEQALEEMRAQVGSERTASTEHTLEQLASCKQELLRTQVQVSQLEQQLSMSNHAEAAQSSEQQVAATHNHSDHQIELLELTEHAALQQSCIDGLQEHTTQLESQLEQTLAQNRQYWQLLQKKQEQLSSLENTEVSVRHGTLSRLMLTDSLTVRHGSPARLQMKVASLENHVALLLRQLSQSQSWVQQLEKAVLVANDRTAAIAPGLRVVHAENCALDMMQAVRNRLVESETNEARLGERLEIESASVRELQAQLMQHGQSNGAPETVGLREEVNSLNVQVRILELKEDAMSRSCTHLEEENDMLQKQLAATASQAPMSATTSDVANESDVAWALLGYSPNEQRSPMR